jgi:hypothetical protein
MLPTSHFLKIHNLMSPFHCLVPKKYQSKPKAFCVNDS